MDNRLAHMDQASFLGLRALGYGALVQFVWIYNRPANLDGLRRFHRNLGYGLLGRLVEPSPLPFARDRWVVSRGPDDIEIAQTPLPRAGLSGWLYHRACLPLDPQHGPGWHTGVVPLDDGGTAVCVTASHTLVDGLGFLRALADAADGKTHDLGYPYPGSRRRGRALLQDARQTAASARELARAAAATVRITRRRRREVAASMASAPPSPRRAGDDRPLVVPSVTAYVDTAEWDARAKSIGGNSFTLFAGFAARLGARMGRVCDDGTVTLSFPVGDRSDDDPRGNAVALPTVSLDPAQRSSDLTDARLEFKQAFADLAAITEELLAPLPLTPLTPKWVARRATGMVLGAARRPIG
ncbi:MAG: hypothetical protein ACRDNS_24930, partial [Trebonia sp.]